ncbi:MAG: leukotoxin LktA family filamentous adhesin [Selenomonas ruminantium]|uniref:Leukotoxin LktA family filamentous adhesin n=1 Tax=Selenomonas ruminantium TaxID=971 RepID=A0A927ZU14_SELRU|nr:leukotoxin LktA family filamentous adhesin [Selenomonas ruminantium]
MSMYRKWAKRRNAIMSVALFGMLALPNMGEATEITKAGILNHGAITTEENGKVHNVLADKMLDANTAFNHFAKFNLSPGNIANLFFGTSRDSATAARLLNFVDSRVDIAGIVNAVQNNKIGGDLRFISPQGIAVSSTGVINAGQVGMVVPTDKYYQELLGNDKLLKSADLLSAKSIQNGEVPLNLAGTITVAGHINTIGGIMLAAANIDLNAGALLNSQKLIDYTNIVNVQDGSVKANIGSGANLTLQRDKESGDIVLAAVVDSKNTAKDIDLLGNLNNRLDKTGVNVFRITNWDISSPIGANIKVANGATITADSNVVIAAKTLSNNFKPTPAANPKTQTAQAKVEEEKKTREAIQNTKPLLKLEAGIELAGEITGKTVNVAATTKDDYQFDKDMAKAIAATNLLQEYIKISGAYMMHKNAANVAIKEGAQIKATGEDIAGAATTPALSILSSSEINAKLTSEGKVEGKKNQLAAATLSYYQNNANLTVDGKLNAEKGSVAATANAKTTIAATASNLASKDDTSHLNFAGNIVIGSTNSQNQLNAGATLDAAKNISVASTLNNSLTVKAENSIKESGLGGSALNFVNTSENAQVTDSAVINAGGKIEVKAVETNTLQQITANNGTAKVEAAKEENKDKDKDKNKDTGTDKAQPEDKDAEDDLGLADLFSDATEATKEEEKKKEEKAAEADKENTEKKDDKKSETSQTKTSALDTASQYVTVGASVNVVLGDSKAGVSINKGAVLNAKDKGTLSISAVQSNPDVQVGSLATSAAGSNGQAKTALINAAVSVTDVTTDASVVIAGSDDDKPVSLTGSSITLKAEANSSHGRLDKLVADIKAINDVKNSLLSFFTGDKWKAPRQHVSDFFTAVGNLTNITKDPSAAQTLVSRGKTLYEDLNTYAKELEGNGIKIAKTLEALDNLTKPVKIANYYVDSSTSSNLVKNREKNTSAGGSVASVSVAGAVNVVNLDDHARVLVGRQTKINTAGDLTIKSGVNKSDIAMNGHLKPSGAASTAIGAVVNVFNSSADSVLAVADKAQLTGNNVTLTGKNDINHYILNGGSGSPANNSNKTGDNDTVADTKALQGTVSYVGGESVTIVSVDNGAKIEATGTLSKEDSQKKIDAAWEKLSADEKKKQKKAEAKESGVVNITAQNDSRVLNIAGGLAYGNGSMGIGASVAVTNFDVKTLSAVSDNNIGSKDEIGSLARKLSVGENLKAADYFGSAGAKAGAINAHSLAMNAKADGYIHSVSVAGGVIEQTDNGKSGGALANFASTINGPAGKFTSFKNSYQTYFKPNEKQDKGTVFSRTMDRFKQSQKKKDKQETGVANMTGGQTMPSFTLAGAGSVSVNLAANQTKSVLQDANVNLRSNGADKAAFANKAADSLFLGAWSGGAALSFQNIKLKKNTSDPATTVGIAGAVGVNSVTSDVLAQVKNSNIQENNNEQQGSFVNTAEKNGALFAGGVGLAVSQARKNSYNFTGAASTSVNIGSSNVDAQVTGVNAKTKNITNKAMDTDTQVTGGVNLSIAAGGKGATSAGGTVAFAHLQNNVNAMFDGGNYDALGNLRNEAIASLTQVGGAVGVSIAAPQGGQSYGFQGVAAYNKLENKTQAVVKNAAVRADAVQNLAQDQATDTSSEYKKYNAALQQADVDVNGDSYTEQLEQKNNDDTKAINADLAKKASYGNKIITAAVGLASSKNGSGLAAMAISDVDNDFTAKIEGGNFVVNNAAQDALKVRAFSNTLDVNTAAGAAASKSGFGAAGSLSLQLTDNDVTAGVESVGDLSAKGISIESGTGASEINVAGQVSVAGSAAFGMAMAYNLLENDTDAYLKNSSINSNPQKFAAGQAKLAVKADSKASVYAVGAGVGVSKELGLNGASAINRGHNSTTAVVDNVKANNIANADVAAADTSKKLAVVGNVQGSGTAAIGGAFVYNDIGGNDERQKTKAAVRNSTLNGAKYQNNDMKVTAKDDSTLTTVGVGVGLSTGTAAVQGVVALTSIQKDVEASIEGANIGSDRSRFAVTTAADTQDNLRTVAAVLSASQNAAIGAGLVMNTDKAVTSAQVSGGKFYTNGLTVDAKGLSNIHNIAAGGGIAAQGAGIVGSVAINDIQTQNRAVLGGGAEVDAYDDSVLIVARGDENIKNIVGILSAAGQGAGVGAAVAKNTIASENYAAVEGENTKVKVTYSRYKNVKDKLINPNQAVVGSLASAVKDKDNKSSAADGEKILDAAANLSDLRGESTYKGIAVSASGTHTIKSMLVNAGAAGQGAAVNGTFNVNEIGGSTKALVDKAQLKDDALGGSEEDISIVARDYSNSYGLVGTVSAAGQGVGAGLGSDSQTITRETTAALTGKKREDISARNLNVEATGWQGIASHAAGIGFAGMGAGLINGTGVYDLRSQTNASVKNVDAYLQGSLNVLADHHGKIYSDIYSLGVAGAGVGVGTGVAVVKEDSRVKAEMEAAAIEVKGGAGNKAAVKALNDTQLTYELYNIGGGGIGGLAGSIGVANVTGDVTARLANTSMRGAKKWAFFYHDDPDKIEVLAQNKLGFNNTAFTGALGLGAGVGVGVAINTLDGRTATILDNVDLKAGEFDIRAQDERDIAQSAYNASAGSVGASANVMITNIGQKLADRYESSANKGKAADGSQVDTGDLLNRANQATKGNQLNSATTDGRTAGSTAVAADRGGKSGSGVSLTISGSKLTAKKGNIVLDSDVLNNVLQENKSVAIGGAAINGAVGILNNASKSAVNLTNTDIQTAQDILLKNQLSGTNELKIRQGAAALSGAAGIAYAGVNSNAEVTTAIHGGRLDAKGDLSLENRDNIYSKLDAIGVSLSAGKAGSALLAENSGTGKNVVVIDNKARLAGGSAMDIQALSLPQVELSAIAASGSLAFSGTGLAARSSYTSSSTVDIGKNSTLSAPSLYISAKNNPLASSKVGSSAASMIAAMSVTGVDNELGTKDNYAKTALSIGDGTTLDAQTIILLTQWNPVQSLELLSLNAGSGAIGVNVGNLSSYGTSDIYVGRANYQKDASLLAFGLGMNEQSGLAGGMTAGGLASGSNLLNANREIKNNVRLDGYYDNSGKLQNVGAAALNIFNQDFKAVGYGAGFATISPWTAVIRDSEKREAVTTLGGTWNLSGTLTAMAQNRDANANLTVDGKNAAVVGLSAVALDRNTDTTAKVVLNPGVNITSTDAQMYYANNQIAVNSNVDAAGYGGVNGSGSKLDNKGVYRALIETGNTGSGTSNFTVNGTYAGITMNADTTGSIKAKNQLEAGGAASLVTAESSHDLTYDNAVKLKNANLNAIGSTADTNLAASDKTTLDFITVANIQGGLGGKATTVNDSVLRRSNTVSLEGGSIFSGRDVNLSAGADSEGEMGELNMQLLADVYNRTVIPVKTKPTYTNSMSQANQVYVGRGSKIESARNIHLKADSGMENIAESAYVYTTYTSKLNSNLITVMPQDKNTREQQSNFITVDGSLLAGLYNALELEIIGKAEDGSIKGNVIKGREWFNPQGISFGNQQTVANPYLKEYNELKLAEAQVAASDQTNIKQTYSAELANLLALMAEKGFAIKRGNSYEVLNEAKVAAVTLPAITVSGGNITFSTPNVKGSGTIKAQGADSIVIRDNSNGRLVVNDLTLAAAGGQVLLNGSDYAAANVQSAKNSQAPVISIQKTGGSGFGADLHIQGNITNNTGKVQIANQVGDILTTGQVSSAYATEISAPNGSYRQTNAGSYQVVGLDPLMPYTFGSELFMQELYRYYAEQVVGEINRGAAPWNMYDSGERAYDWYITDTVQEVFNRMQKTEGGRAEVQRILGDYYDANASKLSAQAVEYLKTKYNSPSAEGSIVAGGDVYIAAKDIIVNGLIQSGYNTYRTDIDAAKVMALDSNVNYSQKLTDSDVLGNHAFLVNKTEAAQLWDSGQNAFEGVINTYYNPYTGHLLTTDTYVKGGNIYLQGNVFSSISGSGRILAAKGAADISVDAADLNKDLYVGAITNNYRNGNIFINGEQQNGNSYLLNGTEPTWERYVLRWTLSAAPVTNTQNYRYKVEKGSHDKTIQLYGKEEALERFEQGGVMAPGMYIDKDKIVTERYTTTNTVNQAESIVSSYLISKEQMDRPTEWAREFHAAYADDPSSWTNPADPRAEEENYWFSPSWRIYDYQRTYTLSPTVMMQINFDKPITTGTLKPADGNITLKGGGNVVLTGDIKTAIKDGRNLGSVDISSAYGAIENNDVRVTTDDLSVKAPKGVNLNVAGNTLVYGHSKNGDITLNAADSLKLSSFNLNDEEGTLSLSARGNITMEDKERIRAKNVKLVSKEGSIGSQNNFVKTYTFSTNRIDAEAKGNIYIQTDNGNMGVGTIKSTGGDVILSATQGSIVDAKGSEIQLSDSQKKVNNWMELGLISAKDTDGSLTAAAAAEKAERLAGLEGRLQTLGVASGKKLADYIDIAKAFAKDSTVLARKANFEKQAQNIDDGEYTRLFNQYRAEQLSWFAKNYQGLSEAEQAAVMDYGLLEASNDYGFSKNQLLYAIQSDIVNSVPGQTVVISSPNIHAKNVTLLAGNDIGYKTRKVSIQAADLNKVENLKLLASVKAGDLTWNEDGSVDVRQRVPVSLDLREGGTITLGKKTRNIFLAGTENTTFNFTSGFGSEISDIVLMTGNGIYLPKNEADRIYAKDLTVYAGRGDIGSLDNYLRTKITDSLEANAGGSIFIDNLGDLTIVSAIAGADRRSVLVGTNKNQPIASGEMSGLFLKTTGVMRMSTERGKDMGYLMGNSINIESAQLGTADNPLRIYSNGAVLNLAYGDTCLNAVGNGSPLRINQYYLNSISLDNPDRFIWMLDRNDVRYKDIYDYYRVYNAHGNKWEEDEFIEDDESDNQVVTDQGTESVVQNNNRSQELVIRKDANSVRITEI